MSEEVSPQGWPVTVKGQVTIPKPVRDHLSLAPGDRVEFPIDPDGAVQIRRRKRSLTSRPTASPD